MKLSNDYRRAPLAIVVALLVGFLGADMLRAPPVQAEVPPGMPFQQLEAQVAALQAKVAALEAKVAGPLDAATLDGRPASDYLTQDADATLASLRVNGDLSVGGETTLEDSVLVLGDTSFLIK